MRQEEIRLEREGGAVLVGTLTLPESVDGACPVVIATHGSGFGLRSFALYEHLKDLLVANNIAALVFDRRGEGDSTGDLSSTSLELLADDARSWLERLRLHPAIDAGRIGLWGISQGGWIAPQAAADDGAAACVIALSPSGVSPAEQMIHAAVTQVIAAGYGPEVVETVRDTRQRIDEFYRGRNSFKDARAAYEAARSEPWFEPAYLAEPIEESSRWQLMMDYDVRPALARLTAPALVIFGDRDVWVPVQKGIDIWQAALPRSTPREIVTLPGMYHYPTRLPDPDEPGEQGPIARDYEDTVTRWLRQVFGMSERPAV